MLYFRKWNFQALRLKKYLIFSEKSFSYISGNRTFQEMELSSSKIKLFLYFCIWNFLASYFSYIPGRNFPSSKSKKKTLWKSLLYFRKTNFIAPSLTIFFIFQEERPKHQNSKFLILFQKKLWINFSVNWNFLNFLNYWNIKHPKLSFLLNLFSAFGYFLLYISSLLNLVSIILLNFS